MVYNQARSSGYSAVGSAGGLGPSGRGFKSLYSDHCRRRHIAVCGDFFVASLRRGTRIATPSCAMVRNDTGFSSPCLFKRKQNPNQPCHCETVRTLSWQSVLLLLSFIKDTKTNNICHSEERSDVGISSRNDTVFRFPCHFCIVLITTP